MLDVIVVMVVLAGLLGMAGRSFVRPDGAYGRTAIGAILAIAIGFVGTFVAGTFASDAAGLGLALIFAAWTALVMATAVLIVVAATAGRLYVALLRHRQG